MSLLDWNSIENSRHVIIESFKCTSKIIPLQWSNIKEILPPFPVVKNTENQSFTEGLFSCLHQTGLLVIGKLIPLR